MPCPKCGYDAAEPDQCARCGIVFSKLGARRERHPTRVVQTPSPRPPRFSRGFKWTLAFLAALLGTAIAVVVSLPPSPRQYGLFELDWKTVTEGDVEKAERVADENPGVPVLRDYVAWAQLLLALRLANERRFDESDARLSEAERWGAGAADVAAFRAFTLRNRGSWDLASQWAARALQLGTRTNPAEMHHIIGVSHYYREDLPHAIEELEKAIAIRRDPDFVESLERARRDLRVAADFGRANTEHFVIRFDPNRMETPGRMVYDELERSYQSLASELGFEPDERIAVVLYTKEEYLAAGGLHDTGGMYDGKIRIRVPERSANEEWVPRIVRHELAHAFIGSRAGYDVPKWLNEGLSEYASGVRGEELPARLDSLPEELSLEGCLIEERCDRDLFYLAAASIVDFLVRFHGMERVRDLLDGLSGGRNLDALLQEMMGKSEIDLVREWQDHLRR